MEKSITFSNGDVLEVRTTEDNNLIIAINDLEDTGSGYQGQTIQLSLDEVRDFLAEVERLVNYVACRR